MLALLLYNHSGNLINSLPTIATLLYHMPISPTFIFATFTLLLVLSLSRMHSLW